MWFGDVIIFLWWHQLFLKIRLARLAEWQRVPVLSLGMARQGIEPTNYRPAGRTAIHYNTQSVEGKPTFISYFYFNIVKGWPDGTWTHDPLRLKQMLYQPSYRPLQWLSLNTILSRKCVKLNRDSLCNKHVSLSWPLQMHIRSLKTSISLFWSGVNLRRTRVQARCWFWLWFGDVIIFLWCHHVKMSGNWTKTR